MMNGFIQEASLVVNCISLYNLLFWVSLDFGLKICDFGLEMLVCKAFSIDGGDRQPTIPRSRLSLCQRLQKAAYLHSPAEI